MNRTTKATIQSIIESTDFSKLKDDLLNIRYKDTSFNAKNEVEKFYLTHNFDNLSQEDFYNLIKEYLKEKLTSQFQRSNNEINYAPLSIIEQSIINNFRKNLLNQLKKYAETYQKYENVKYNSGIRYVDYYIAYQEIQTCSDQKLFHFYNAIKEFKQEQINFYQNNNANLFNYFVNNDLADIAIPYIFDSSFLHKGNGLYRFNLLLNHPQFDDSDVENLQFINNLIELNKLGCLESNMFFDGKRFSTCGQRVDDYKPLDITQTTIYSQLMSGENLREHQSQLAYDDSVQNTILRSTKYPIIKFSHETDSECFETTLFTRNEFDVTFPIIVKQTAKSKTDDTCGIICYIIEQDDIKFATQLYRIDKDNPLNPWGTPSTHKQRGGERILKECHTHQGSLLEQLLSTKGSYNIFQNYTLDSTLSFDELNAIFNDYCNTVKNTNNISTIPVPNIQNDV